MMQTRKTQKPVQTGLWHLLASHHYTKIDMASRITLSLPIRHQHQSEEEPKLRHRVITFTRSRSFSLLHTILLQSMPPDCSSLAVKGNIPVRPIGMYSTLIGENAPY